MNLSVFMGNLTRDFELRMSQSGVSVARAGMALNRGKDKDGKDKGADFINLIAFGKTAEFCEKYGRKGRKFVVKCHVQTGSYKNKDGATVYTTDFVIEEINFADSKPEGAGVTQKSAKPADENGFVNIPDDIDMELPFN